MKKTGWIVCVMTIVAMVVLGTFMMAAAEGEGLTLVETYPEDGQKNVAAENLGIKLTFSAPVNLEANQAENNKCFKITGPDGDLDIKVYYNPEIPEQVLVLKETPEGAPVRQQLTSSEEYTVKISGSFKDNNGNALGEDKTISFTTANVKRNNYIYFALMAAMMVGMVFFTTRQAKSQAAASAANGETGAVDTFNPYKEAKRTGKSLAQVIAEHDREVAKQQAREAKRIVKEEEYYEEEEESGNYRVKGPRPISAAGSTYKTGRKAEAEARAAAAEERAKKKSKKKK